MKRLFLILPILWFGGCFDAAQEHTPSGKAVTVAVIATQEGTDGTFGRQGMEGFKAALRAYPLLKNGDRVDVRFFDDNHSELRPSDAVDMAKTIGAAALVSIQNSDLTLKLGPAVSRVQLPTIAVTATHEAIPASGYVSQLSMNNETEGDVAAFYARDEMLLDRAAIVYDRDNAFSTSLASRFKTTFESLGGTVTVFAAMEQGAESMRTMHRHGTQLIYAPLYTEGITPLLEAKAQMDWDVTFMGADGLLGDFMQKRPSAVTALDGVVIVEHFADMMPATQTAGIAKRALASDGLAPSTMRYLGFESFLLLRSALEACDGYEAACVNDRLRNSGALEGIGGVFRLKEGRAERPVFIDRIEDGTLHMLVKIY